jgi:beta-lactamase regulating signal transducer with metallopeptidase domain
MESLLRWIARERKPDLNQNIHNSAGKPVIERRKAMFTRKQRGASLVEWIVVVVVVVAVLGAAAMGIATVTSGRAGVVSSWIGNLSVEGH